jgi:hypothetical protein
VEVYEEEDDEEEDDEEYIKQMNAFIIYCS